MNNKLIPCLGFLCFVIFGYTSLSHAQSEDAEFAPAALSLGANAQHPGQNAAQIQDPDAPKPTFNPQAFREQTIDLEKQEDVIFATKRDFGVVTEEDEGKQDRAAFGGKPHPQKLKKEKAKDGDNEKAESKTEKDMSKLKLHVIDRNNAQNTE